MQMASPTWLTLDIQQEVTPYFVKPLWFQDTIVAAAQPSSFWLKASSLDQHRHHSETGESSVSTLDLLNQSAPFK